MAQHKVTKLDGFRLNQAVAIASLRQWRVLDNPYATNPATAKILQVFEDANPQGFWTIFSPSKSWDDAGPIIERENIDLIDGTAYIGLDWVSGSEMGLSKARGNGPTVLIAAMRAFVASRLGDTVELP